MSRILYPQKRQKRRSRIKAWPFVVLLVLAGYVSYALLRPLPLLQPTSVNKQLRVGTPSAKLNWPPTAQAAVALPGTDIVATHGEQKSVPIASTAKVITALTVLQKKPLKPGEQGPVITLTAQDVAFYNNYVAVGGSVVPVSVGEQISQYQMIQALMLPSANNIADTMAIWAFGSIPEYLDAANKYVAAHGMADTTLGGDASGLHPASISTARDLARAGSLAMESPVLREIVAQASTTQIPLAGNVRNVNSLLGTSNIVGIKTGNTDQAGGVFISASRVTVAGKPVTIVTSVVGSITRDAALRESLTLVQSAQKNFGPVKIVRKGDVVARYNQPWGPSVTAVASKDLTTFAWLGSNVHANAQLEPLNPERPTQGSVGTVSTKTFAGTAESITLELSEVTQKPSVVWRLLHVF